MATLSFAGTTIWNDSSTGVGRVLVYSGLKQAVYQSELIPRGQGEILKKLGTTLGEITVVCKFHLPSGDVDNLRSLVEGKVDEQGSLVTPEDGTITNCVMMQADLGPRAPKVIRIPGTGVREVRELFMVFRKVK